MKSNIGFEHPEFKDNYMRMFFDNLMEFLVWERSQFLHGKYQWRCRLCDHDPPGVWRMPKNVKQHKDSIKHKNAVKHALGWQNFKSMNSNDPGNNSCPSDSPVTSHPSIRLTSLDSQSLPENSRNFFSEIFGHDENENFNDGLNESQGIFNEELSFNESAFNSAFPEQEKLGELYRPGTNGEDVWMSPECWSSYGSLAFNETYSEEEVDVNNTESSAEDNDNSMLIGASKLRFVPLYLF